ncbi:hypothetical protein ALC53_11293 [Atta colombica]|uniref:Uncharacterized protein n=1 Tax=Atta colombica TaxID=520822 RepID=A0A195B1A4_9HYME|nr:hypothetical protein ALC53_11293 [Atta colombica]
MKGSFASFPEMKRWIERQRRNECGTTKSYSYGRHRNVRREKRVARREPTERG